MIPADLLPGDAFDRTYVVPGQPPTERTDRHVVKSLHADDHWSALRVVLCADGPVVMRHDRKVRLVAESFLRAPNPMPHHWVPADQAQTEETPVAAHNSAGA